MAGGWGDAISDSSVASRGDAGLVPLVGILWVEQGR